MKMTRRVVVAHLESSITLNVWRDSSPHIDHSWVRMNTGLMTDSAKFRPADHHLHKVLRHPSAHWSVCPGNVSKWSASIATTYSDLGYWLFFGVAFCTFGAVIGHVENRHCRRLLAPNGSAFSQATQPHFWCSPSDWMPVVSRSFSKKKNSFSTFLWRINFACFTRQFLLAKEKKLRCQGFFFFL